jgi:hypothetical protein
VPADPVVDPNDLDEAAFRSLYGRWDPLTPSAVAGLLAGSGIRWYIAGGRAARVGAPARHHEDIDVVVRVADLAELRRVLAGFDLWEAHSGALRPLLPGAPLTDGREQLWARRDAEHPWQLDLPLDLTSDDSGWVFKRDSSIRLPWDRALQQVDGIAYLRPELALLHKAKLDRPKDRADLAAAVLDPAARAWLAATLRRLGYHVWAQLVLDGAGPAGTASGHTCS